MRKLTNKKVMTGSSRHNSALAAGKKLHLMCDIFPAFIYKDTRLRFAYNHSLEVVIAIISRDTFLIGNYWVHSRVNSLVREGALNKNQVSLCGNSDIQATTKTVAFSTYSTGNSVAIKP